MVIFSIFLFIAQILVYSCSVALIRFKDLKITPFPFLRNNLIYLYKCVHNHHKRWL
jgi:hypothetical protein